jgi:hypothetical protein
MNDARFTPTDEWQDVPDGAILPGGLHYRVDVTTGRKQARLLQDDLEPATDRAAVEDFLVLWCAGLPHVTLIGIKPDGPTRGRVFRWPEELPDLLTWVEAMNPDHNIYFSVGLADPRVNKKPTKANLIALVAQHADLDPRDGAPLAEERARLLALADELTATDCPPSFIIDSGGGIQVFYRAAEPIAADPETIADLEDLNRRLEATLGGKGTHNADRIMRLPGTINWPNKKKRKAGRAACQARLLHGRGHTCDRDQIERAIAALEDEPPVDAPEPIPEPERSNGAAEPKRRKQATADLPEPATEDQIESLLEHTDLAAIWRKTATPPPDDTQSGWDYHLCARLARAGFTATMAARYLRAYLLLHAPESDHAARADYHARTVAAAFGRKRQPEEWPEPGVLGEPPPAPAFPTDLLPGQLRAWVERQAENMAIPPEVLAIPALVTIGSAIGKNAIITPKVHDPSWTERPCLWGPIIMEKGQGKSPALKEAAAPINHTEARQREAWKIRHDAWRLRQEPRKKAKHELGQGVGSDDPEPIQPKLVLTDTSIEAAADAMVNSRGLVLIRDELSGWLANMARYNQGSDRQFWLECHSGGPYRIDRIQRGRQIVPDVFCGVVGGIQPKVARRAFSAALDGVDDGLFERFGLACYPDPLPWTGLRDVAPERDHRRNVSEAVMRLAELDCARDQPLRFDPEAQAVFNIWYDEHMRTRVRGPAATERPDHGFMTKGQGLVLRLCIVLHWFRWTTADGVFEDNRLTVDHRSLDAALGIFERFCVPTYARLAAAFGKIEAHEGASRVAALIKRRKLARIRIADVTRMDWAALHERAPIVAALEALEDIGWLRPVAGASGRRGGRPADHWAVNPKVHD